MELKKDTLTIGWCDNGTTDGKFTQGLIYTILGAKNLDVEITNAVRVHGNQIGRQRQALLDGWYDQLQTEWILWVDSDIVLTVEVLNTLLKSVNPITHPIVSGVYFVSGQKEGTLKNPLPVIFNDIDEFTLQHIHPLPENQLIKIDSAGFGLVLMHRSVVKKMRKKFPKEPLFVEQEGLKRGYLGEDIAFFRKAKKAKIPIHAHTGALVNHVKRFDFDVEYYKLFWENYTE
jgi:hypothetical protein